ncbi:MAG: hypothetical protein AB1831_04265 [Pseudomonadota bacterium]
MPSLKAFKSLLRLYELPEAEFTQLHLRQITESRSLIEAGALRESPFPDSILVPYHDEEVPVDIGPDPDRSGIWRYTCPETGRHLTVSAAEIQLYAADYAWLVQNLAAQLSPGVQPDPEVLIPGVLWHAGAHAIGDRTIDVLVARRLDANITAVVGVLQARTFRQPTLILATGRPRRPLQTNVGRFIPLALADCLHDQGGEARLDTGYLAHAIGLPRESLVTADQVYFDPASGKLRLPGKPEIQFTGDQHIAVVYELYLAWQRGSPSVKGEELLNKAGSSSPSIPQLFSGKKDWKVYIANPKKGWYRLAV